MKDLTFEQSERFTKATLAKLKKTMATNNAPWKRFVKDWLFLCLGSLVALMVYFMMTLVKGNESLAQMFILIYAVMFVGWTVTFIVGATKKSFVVELFLRHLCSFTVATFIGVVMIVQFIWMMMLTLNGNSGMIFLLLCLVMVIAAILQVVTEYRFRRRSIQEDVTLQKSNIFKDLLIWIFKVSGYSQEKYKKLIETVEAISFARDEKLSKYHDLILKIVFPVLVAIATVASYSEFTARFHNISGVITGVVNIFIAIPVMIYIGVWWMGSYANLEMIKPCLYIKQFAKEYADKHDLNFANNK